MSKTLDDLFNMMAGIKETMKDTIKASIDSALDPIIKRQDYVEKEQTAMKQQISECYLNVICVITSPQL